ncbi:hypothetical protein PCE1_002346 [Barthelona sp. PCE]
MTGTNSTAKVATSEVATDSNSTDPPVKSEQDAITHCSLCFHETSYYCIRPCGHSSVCAKCVLRLRKHYKSCECPICRSEEQLLIIADTPNQALLGLEHKESLVSDRHDSDLFYSSQEVKRGVLRWDHPLCPECGQHCRNVSGLKKHLWKEHQLKYCNLCLNHRKKFLCELSVYSEDDVRVHMTKGLESEIPFTGHPQCKACYKFFSDMEALKKHVREKEIYCEICMEENCVSVFRTREELQRHYDSKHFLCSHGQCRHDLCVVFKDDSGLLNHIQEQHPGIYEDVMMHGGEYLTTVKRQLVKRSERKNRQQKMEGVSEVDSGSVPDSIRQERNRIVLTKVYDILNKDEMLFNEFRELSEGLMHGVVTPIEYLTFFGQQMKLFSGFETQHINALNAVEALIKTIPDGDIKKQLISRLEVYQTKFEKYPPISGAQSVILTRDLGPKLSTRPPKEIRAFRSKSVSPMLVSPMLVAQIPKSKPTLASAIKAGGSLRNKPIFPELEKVEQVANAHRSFRLPKPPKQVQKREVQRGALNLSVRSNETLERNVGKKKKKKKKRDEENVTDLFF